MLARRLARTNHFITPDLRHLGHSPARLDPARSLDSKARSADFRSLRNAYEDQIYRSLPWPRKSPHFRLVEGSRIPRRGIFSAE
jgi:hypothetical protein